MKTPCISSITGTISTTPAFRASSWAGRWQATDQLAIKAGYTYTDSAQKGGLYDDLPLSRTPEHMASLRADYARDRPPEPVGRGLLSRRRNQCGPSRRHQRRTPSWTARVRSAAAIPTTPCWTWAPTGGVRDDVTLKLGVYNLTDKVLNVATYDFQVRRPSLLDGR